MGHVEALMARELIAPGCAADFLSNLTASGPLESMRVALIETQDERGSCDFMVPHNWLKERGQWREGPHKAFIQRSVRLSAQLEGSRWAQIWKESDVEASTTTVQRTATEGWK